MRTDNLAGRAVAAASWALVLGCAARAGAQGADLIVADVNGSTAYVSAGSPKSYSLGLTYCNLGGAPAGFESVTAGHPVVTQNMYRLQDGRLVQIGQAWAQHLTAGALQQNLCSACTPWPDQSKLGAGCSSSDTATFLGVQSTFGAKSEVNAAAGTFTWPRVNMGTGSGATFKRLQVPIAEMPAGPLYFVSAMIVSADDSAAGNSQNNESYRRVTIGFAAPSMPLSLTGATQRGAPAIQAWKDHGLGVGLPDPDVILAAVDVPGDGRFWVASKATPLGAGYWHYEYAVQNLTSHRGAGTFAVPTPAGALASGFDFHGVTYHSGEPYSNALWVSGAYATEVRWDTPSPYDVDPNTSALRWDTLYNFWFDCDRPPVTGAVTLGLFRPGTPTAVSVGAVIPQGAVCGSADFNCDGDTGTDADIEAFFACVAGNCPAPPCAGTADFNGDGDVGTDADIEAFFRVLAGTPC